VDSAELRQAKKLIEALRKTQMSEPLPQEMPTAVTLRQMRERGGERR
jgi:hypothetical protein